MLMVGITLIPLGVSKFMGIEYSGDGIDPLKLIAATITLFIMIGVNIWVKGKVKLYSVLIGIAAGYLLSVTFGFIGPVDFQMVSQTPLFSIPGKGSHLFRFAFNLSLVVPFTLVAIVQSLKTFGNLTTCQKLNDADWKKPDMKNIRYP
ncbi:MAG: hypothetical protein D4R67_03655 [Bacteroidetes bacterium]|nr:MAG: hypothetical protein D4R67_03655 [Bacteroidota bacterium]